MTAAATVIIMMPSTAAAAGVITHIITMSPRISFWMVSGTARGSCPNHDVVMFPRQNGGRSLRGHFA